MCNRERGPDELQDWEKHKQKIEEGERRREKLQDMMLAVSLKCKQYVRATGIEHPCPPPPSDNNNSPSLQCFADFLCFPPVS